MTRLASHYEGRNNLIACSDVNQDNLLFRVVYLDEYSRNNLTKLILFKSIFRIITFLKEQLTYHEDAAFWIGTVKGFFEMIAAGTIRRFVYPKNEKSLSNNIINLTKTGKNIWIVPIWV
jgi:hypothetical protein